MYGKSKTGDRAILERVRPSKFVSISIILCLVDLVYNSYFFENGRFRKILWSVLAGFLVQSEILTVFYSIIVANCDCIHSGGLDVTHLRNTTVTRVRYININSCHRIVACVTHYLVLMRSDLTFSDLTLQMPTLIFNFKA